MPRRAEEYARAAALGRPDAAARADTAALDAIKSAQQAQQWPAVIEARPRVHRGAPRIAAAARRLRRAARRLSGDCRRRRSRICARAIDARIALRPDPMAYTLGANLLLVAARGLAARRTARRARPAPPASASSARTRAATSSMARSRARSTARRPRLPISPAGQPICRRRRPLAEKRLAEASRLSRGLDATNQIASRRALEGEGRPRNGARRTI